MGVGFAPPSAVPPHPPLHLPYISPISLIYLQVGVLKLLCLMVAGPAELTLTLLLLLTLALTLTLTLTLTLILTLTLTRKPNLRQGLGLEIATPGRTWVFLAEDHDEQARDIGEI